MSFLRASSQVAVQICDLLYLNGEIGRALTFADCELFCFAVLARAGLKMEWKRLPAPSPFPRQFPFPLLLAHFPSTWTHCILLRACVRLLHKSTCRKMAYKRQAKTRVVMAYWLASDPLIATVLRI